MGSAGGSGGGQGGGAAQGGGGRQGAPVNSGGFGPGPGGRKNIELEEWMKDKCSLLTPGDF